jgi:DNA-binding transcriptional ArsR family regulator
LQRLRSLERAELVTRDETVSDFNWASPIARETVCVVSRYARRQCPLFPLVEESALGEGHLQIFGSPTRTKLLLAVARLKHASLGELAAEAGVTLDAARAAADALKRAGVLEIDLCRNRRIVNLDPDQLGFSEVAALLEALNCAAATRR